MTQILRDSIGAIISGTGYGRAHGLLCLETIAEEPGAPSDRAAAAGDPGPGAAGLAPRAPRRCAAVRAGSGRAVGAGHADCRRFPGPPGGALPGPRPLAG